MCLEYTLHNPWLGQKSFYAAFTFFLIKARNGEGFVPSKYVLFHSGSEPVFDKNDMGEHGNLIFLFLKGLNKTNLGNSKVDRCCDSGVL